MSQLDVMIKSGVSKWIQKVARREGSLPTVLRIKEIVPFICRDINEEVQHLKLISRNQSLRSFVQNIAEKYLEKIGYTPSHPWGTYEYSRFQS